MFKDYLIQNWALILILPAFAIVLKTTIFLDKKTVRRMYFLISTVFVLSVAVFTEFRLEALGVYPSLRVVLMSVRYSATPFITALIIYTLVKKQRKIVFIPAALLAVIDFISIFTGIVFSVNDDNEFKRGPLGLLPFIVSGIYFVILIYMLTKRSNKQMTEIVPIAFLGGSFASGLILPFVFGKDFSNIFCTTIAAALFVYFVFSILQLTKKDPLTGLLNRQAYYADVGYDPKSINALVSLDMNGLKTTNDTLGHAAGDEALLTLALCFLKAARRGQSVYRVGGDEFVIVCRHTSHSETIRLVERIRKYVADTKYSCSVGYVYSEDGTRPIDDLLKASDEMMYADKARYYETKRNLERITDETPEL